MTGSDKWIGTFWGQTVYVGAKAFESKPLQLILNFRDDAGYRDVYTASLDFGKVAHPTGRGMYVYDFSFWHDDPVIFELGSSPAAGAQIHIDLGGGTIKPIINQMVNWGKSDSSLFKHYQGIRFYGSGDAIIKDRFKLDLTFAVREVAAWSSVWKIVASCAMFSTKAIHPVIDDDFGFELLDLNTDFE